MISGGNCAVRQAALFLNLAEGMYSRGQNRAVRYHSALGSMREAQSCLEVAVAFGYVRHLDVALSKHIDHVTGTLVRLVEGPS